jgi:ergothioneine biosynthesis protein EgtB
MTAIAADNLLATLLATRAQTEALCAPLSPEDCNLQGAAFASPPKWHLAHSSWFFETFLLKPFLHGYRSPDPIYEVLFNSYYQGVGRQHPRPERGLLSRPALAEVLAYRRHIDEGMAQLLEQAGHAERDTLLERCALGIEHERQHQELLLTDIKYSFSRNPLYPAYRADAPPCAVSAAAGSCGPGGQPETQWLEFAGGLVEIGHRVEAGEGFAFDNESPRHPCFLAPYALSDRLVSNADYQAFIADDGYRRADLWLAEGWDTVQREGLSAPLYWLERDGEALEFTLYGLQPRDDTRPVCHLSAFEADAYARWAGARLPTEAEWEHAAASSGQLRGTHPEQQQLLLHPPAVDSGAPGLAQLYGSCWQWTGSAYSPYPGFAPAAGAIGEYNGKFMCNQLVLRGGSCVTARSQSRYSYRNFFYTADRWQFSGLRLARDLQT